jgi:pyridoxamine 5'-phosphate oxidase family protein
MFNPGGMDFTETELDYLSSQRLGRLATVGPDGAPQNNPVGFHHNTGLGTIDIYGHNMAASRKFRNIQKNDQVSLVIDDIRSVAPWAVRGLEIRGRAEAVTNEAPADPRFSGALIRIHPETIFTWGLDATSKGMTKRTAAA